MSSVQRVLGTKGLQKGVTNIFSMDIILEYNVRGIQGKKRLLDYKKIINVLFRMYYLCLSFNYVLI